MSDEIIKVLEWLAEKLGVTIDWASQQVTENLIPYFKELCQRYATYQIVSSCIGVVIGVVCLISAAIIAKKLVKEYKRAKSEDEENAVYDPGWGLNGLGIAGICKATGLFVAGIIVTLVCADSLFQWIFIPEVKIFEMVKAGV